MTATTTDRCGSPEDYAHLAGLLEARVSHLEWERDCLARSETAARARIDALHAELEASRADACATAGQAVALGREVLALRDALAAAQRERDEARCETAAALRVLSDREHLASGPALRDEPVWPAEIGRAA